MAQRRARPGTPAPPDAAGLAARWRRRAEWTRPGPERETETMRIGVSLQERRGPDPMSGLREQAQRAADDGFASVWLSNIFGLDALTTLAVVGNQVSGIELGTAVVPVYPR